MREDIKSIMVEVFECSIPDNASQDNVENWDSLRHLNLIIAIESKFDVEFEPEEIALMKSIDKIEEILKKK